MGIPAVGYVEDSLGVHRQAVRILESRRNKRLRGFRAADRKLHEPLARQHRELVLAREHHAARRIDRNLRPRAGNQVCDKYLVRGAEGYREDAVARCDSADLRLGVLVAERIAGKPLLAVFQQSGDAELEVLARIVRAYAAHVKPVLRDWLRPVVRGKERRGGPCPADPLASARLASVERDEGQPVGTFRYVRAERDGIIRAVASPDERGGLWRGMVREPGARVVGKAPRRRAGPVDGTFVDRFHGLDRDALDNILPRIDGTVWNRVQSVLRRVHVAAEIVRAVPLDDIAPCGERTRVDEVADAASVLRLDDKRRKPIERHLECDVDSVWLLVGLERLA